MKSVSWDTGVGFDDVNLRWGDPSYLLDLGDPGYVADPTSASFPAAKPRKRHTMPKSDFVKNRDAEFADQLLLFKMNIAGYATALGLSAGQTTAQAADADYFANTLAVQQVCSNCAEQWTAWKDLMRDGGDPGSAPSTGVFPAAVPPVAPGIERRFRDLVRQCKAAPAYDVPMGQALGMEGAVQTGPDFTTFKPVLTLRPSGGQVMVGWGWQGQGAFLDMIKIHVNRGTGCQMLAFDSTPDYLDTFAAPAGGAKWTYKTIYRLGDQRVGQWSDEAGISVAG